MIPLQFRHHSMVDFALHRQICTKSSRLRCHQVLKLLLLYFVSNDVVCTTVYTSSLSLSMVHCHQAYPSLVPRPLPAFQRFTSWKWPGDEASLSTPHLKFHIYSKLITLALVCASIRQFHQVCYIVTRPSHPLPLCFHLEFVVKMVRTCIPPECC